LEARDHLEIEAKAHCPDPVGVEDKLVSMGAELVEDIHQKDTYYKHPTRDYAATDEALRIREVSEETRVTYKGPKLDQTTKTRVEIELSVDGDAHSLLMRLKFEPVRVVEKQRRVYHLAGLEVCVDRVKDLGSFVEIESKSSNRDIEGEKKRIFELLHELGLEKFERKSYLELLLDLESD
jgi:adenylate cyclase class 2